MKKSIALVAMCATALSPILSAPAYADIVPDPVPEYLGEVFPEMTAQCDALADARDTGNGDEWSGEVIPGNATLIAGPTEVGGSRVVDESTIQPLGDYVPSVKEIRGDPFRIGGSVNMFGDQWSSEGYYPHSTYFFEADFDSTFSYAASCAISRAVFHEGEPIHHRAVGVYVILDDYHGRDEEAVRRNCEQLRDNGQDWWGDEFFPENSPKCRFEGTPAYDEPGEDYLDPPVLVDTVALDPVPREQTVGMRAFEDFGEKITVVGEYHIGQVVICISPSTTSKNTQSTGWRLQNGYTGPNCTTDWFKNHAIWGAGTENSNGTFTSVPDYHLY
ncbi:hypothetical protein N0B51_13700 [Tsuneonella sp. YG55]|uniref:Secreted protein n=1 Tax=Tsuneonella litorea TaxID=2976475 RepID=A0A9X2W308_9SPHN|nr:hypothetical protein [Tsuneonella litorea]MCT2560033.1 hypothetical protein [Tsuneonella litorea]